MRSTAMPAAAITARAVVAGGTHARAERGVVEAVEHEIDGLHDDRGAGRRSRSRAPTVTPGKRGTSARLEADLLDQRADMQRAAAAERHRDELSPDRGRARSRRGGSRRPCAHRRPARSPPPPPSASRPSGSPTCAAIAARAAASTSSRASSPPIGRARIDAAEHDLGVGQGRARRCPGRSRPAPAPSRRFPGRPAAGRRGRPRRSSRRRRRWW